MFTLTITHTDGSIYWVEHFNSLADANRWIGEEQTRPYWDATWTYTIVTSPPPPDWMV